MSEEEFYDDDDDDARIDGKYYHITTKPMRIGDCARVAQLYAEAFGDGELRAHHINIALEPWSREDDAHCDGENPSKMLIMITEGYNGWNYDLLATVRVVISGGNSRHGYIDSMCVDESVRGKGYGAELLRRVEQDLELTSMSCYADPPAVGFYEKHGWVRDTRRRGERSYSISHEAIAMCKGVDLSG